MQLKSAALQEEINNLDVAIQQGMTAEPRESDAQLTMWEMNRKDLQDQLQAALESEQAHENRVQEATSNITTRVDTLYLGGKTLREMCADEEAYQILKISFTQDYISQATKNSEVLSQVQAEAQTAIKQANDRADDMDEQNTKLLQEKHKLSMELEEVTGSFKAAELLLSEAPSSEETDKLKQEIKDLKAQLEIKAKADEPIGDAKSQIDALILERENKKVKITNLRLADPSGINTKDYLATDVLTGIEISIHSNYVKSYKEVSVEEAEQIRADEANKKAEAEEQAASIPETKEPDIAPVNDVLPKEAPAAEETFQSEEVSTTTTGLANQSLPLSGEEEGEVNSIQERLETDPIVFTYGQLKKIWNLEREVAEIKAKQAAA